MMFGTIHRKNAIVGVAFALAVSPLGAQALASALLGGAIQLLNIRLLDHSVSRIVGSAVAAGRASAGLVHLRLLGLLTVVAYVLFIVPVDVIGFSVGLSTAVPAAIWHGLATAHEAR